MDFPPVLTPEEKCIADCIGTNTAMCMSLAAGGSGIGLKAGAIASIPTSGSMAGPFMAIGAGLGGTLTGEMCANKLARDCREKCMKRSECN